MAKAKFRSIMECYRTEVFGVCVNSKDEDGVHEVAKLYFEMRDCDANEDATDTLVEDSPKAARNPMKRSSILIAQKLTCRSRPCSDDSKLLNLEILASFSALLAAIFQLFAQLARLKLNMCTYWIVARETTCHKL